jgi:ABC-2 type transport system ATP-binding protein
MSVLEVSGLRKCYNGTPAVDGLSLALGPGEVLGLLGPNGAGKTTTMMMIAGLLEPDAGQVWLSSDRLTPRSRAGKKLLGVVPQDLAVYPDLSAMENLHFFGSLYGLDGSSRASRAAEILDWIGLTEHAGAAVRTFSGGMKRRLNFGVALMHRPQVLILDEPTVGVDPQSRAHLLECVRDLARQGVGVIYASHYMEEVEAICHRVAIVDHGNLLACDTVDNLLQSVSAAIHLHVADPQAAAAELGDLVEITTSEGGGAVLAVRAGRTSLSQSLHNIMEILSLARIEVQRVDTEAANLERLFLNLTGHRLRD